MCVEDRWVELQPTPIQSWADLHDSWAELNTDTAAEPTADSATGFISDTAAEPTADSAAGSSHKRAGEGL